MTSIAFERLLGRTRDALLGTHVADVFEAVDRDATRRLFHSTLGGRSQHAELHYRTGRGELRAGSFQTIPIVEGGRVVGVLGIVSNATAAPALVGGDSQSEEVATVSQLVAGVAHEIKNPLMGITAFAEVLLASLPEDSEQREAVTMIHAEAKRATRIVSDILAFARQRAPERAEVDLNQLLQDTFESRRPQLRAQQIEVEITLEPSLPKARGDRCQLQQVLLNLLINAEQAMQEQPSNKRLVLGTRQDGDRLVACVSDSGPGIPRKLLARIFDPFYTTKAAGQGTGLGLAIAESIVRAHGGQISVQSVPGAGSTFCVELPAVQDAQLGAVAACKRRPRASGAMGEEGTMAAGAAHR